MSVRRKWLGVAVALGIGSLVWAGRNIPVSAPETTAPDAANLLGIEWVSNDTTPTGSTTPTENGLGVDWVSNDTTPTGGTPPTENGLGIDWVSNNPTPAGGPTDGGLNLDWVTTNPTPGGSTGGLDLGWAGKSPLDEQAIRLSYQRAFGREPSPADLTKELNRQSYDQTVRSLHDLLEAHRTYLKSYSGESERKATIERALKAMPGEPNLIAQSGLLYEEMVRKLALWTSYKQAFGRAPLPQEEQERTEGDLATLIQAHRLRIRENAAMRAAVIDLAYRTTWKRSPVDAERSTWESDLKQTGKTYTELVAAISGKSDPIMPLAPVVLRHDSRMGTSHDRRSHTTIYFVQQGDRAERFRILRQNAQTREWAEVGTQPANGAGREHSFADQYQLHRADYRVCALNQHGEACSEPYATTDRPNPVHIAQAKADSPTVIGIHWYRVGDDVLETAVKRQRADGGWEEVFREKAGASNYHRYFETVKPATQRTYVVCAYNAKGETCTPWLHIESPLPVAVAPADFKVEAQNQTDWRISWRAQTQDPVRVQRWNSQSRQWDLLSEFRSSETAFTRRELGADAFYEYRVCANTGYSEACTPSITVGKQFDHPTNFTALDYGIYWFRCGTCRGSTKASDEGTQSDGVKAVPGLSKEYFDPARPTVIYVHGWARNSVKESGRESMKSPIDKQDMMALWRNAGWNVGVFYWNAISDDDWGAEPRTAEGKIDTGNYQWSQADGKGGSHYAATRVSDPASVLFARSIVEAMQGYQGPEFRIVGHSLGTQMAVMGTYYVSRSQYAHLTPQRVALLDPWISSGTRAAGLGDLIDRVKQSHGTTYEYYQTSVISQEHGHYGSRAVTSRVHPMYVDWTNPGGAHAAAIHWYFGSLAYRGNAPSARMPLADLKPLMNCGCRFEQDGGKDTTSPADDVFLRYKK